MFSLWALLSFTGSFIKNLDRDMYSDRYSTAHVSASNCGKTYPIDFILYTNLFCEIGDL